MSRSIIIQVLLVVGVLIAVSIPAILEYQNSETRDDHPIKTVRIEQGNSSWPADTLCVNGVTYFEKYIGDHGATPLWNLDGTLVPCTMIMRTDL